MSTICMRTVLTALALAAVALPSLGQQLANLTCFDAGLTDDCSSFVDTFCTSANAVSLAFNNSVSQCFQNGANRCDFTAWRGQPPASSNQGSFDGTNCEFALQIVSAACPKGGSARVVGGGSFFTLNPDAHQCGATSAIVP